MGNKFINYNCMKLKFMVKRYMKKINPSAPSATVPHSDFFLKGKAEVFRQLRETGGVEGVEKYDWVFRKEAQIPICDYIKQVIKFQMNGRTFGGTIVDKSFCKALNASGTIGSSGKYKRGNKKWRKKHGFSVTEAQEICWRNYKQSCWHRARDIVKEAFCNPISSVEKVNVPIVRVFDLMDSDKPIRVAGRGFFTCEKLCGVMGVDLDYCRSVVKHGFKDILIGEDVYEISYKYEGKKYCFVLHDETRFTSHRQAMEFGYLPEHLYQSKIRVWK